MISPLKRRGRRRRRWGGEGALWTWSSLLTWSAFYFWTILQCESKFSHFSNAPAVCLWRRRRRRLKRRPPYSPFNEVNGLLQFNLHRMNVKLGRSLVQFGRFHLQWFQSDWGVFACLSSRCCRIPHRNRVQFRRLHTVTKIITISATEGGVSRPLKKNFR